MRKNAEAFLTTVLSVIFGAIPVLLGTNNIVVLALLSGAGAVVGLLLVNYFPKENTATSNRNEGGNKTLKYKLEFLFSLRILTAIITLVIFAIVYHYCSKTSEFVFGKIYNFIRHLFHQDTQNTIFDPLFQNATLRHFVHLSYSMFFAILINWICNIILDMQRRRVNGHSVSYSEIVYAPFQALILYLFYNLIFLGLLGLLSDWIAPKEIPINVYTYLYCTPIFVIHITSLHSGYKEMRKHVLEKV